MRTRDGKTTLEFKWDVDSPNSSLRFDQEGIIDYRIDKFDEYSVFLSIESLTKGKSLTDVRFAQMYGLPLTNVATLPYVLVGSVCMMGYWVACQTGNTLRINQVWDSYRRQGVTISTAMNFSSPVGIGLCSVNGSVGLFVISSENGYLEVRTWLVTGLAAGAELTVYVAVSRSAIEMLGAIWACVIIVEECDKSLWIALRRARLREIAQGYDRTSSAAD